MAGEAILPAAAWEREKERLLATHEAAVIAYEAKKAARRRAIAALSDRLRERCVVRNDAPCRRLVLLNDTSSPYVEVTVGVAAAAAGAPCPYGGKPLLLTPPAPPAPAPRPRPAPPASPPSVPDDVPVLKAKDVAARLAFKDARAERLAGVACRVDVKPRWRRLLKGQTIAQVRIAAGHDVARGATASVKTGATMTAGVGVNVDVGDHIKVVVGTDAGYIGGVIGAFAGSLPFVRDSGSLKVSCR